MKIVIAGAGDMGFHLARLLSVEQQDIVLIDINSEVLEYAATHLDVHTIQGDSASIRILEKADIRNASLFLAMTTSEKNNLMSCILAKKFGAKYAIARINNEEYLAQDQKESFMALGIDSLICPSLLAAKECVRLVAEATVTDLFDFDEGRLSLAGIEVDDSSPVANQTVEEISRLHGSFYRPVAILRGQNTIIPKPTTSIHRRDHLYFVAPKREIENVLQIFGKDIVRVRNIMITGGDELGLKTASLLEDKYNVVVVEQNKEYCKRMTGALNKTLIVRGDPSNIELLQEEGLDRMDALIALTPNSESNIITCLLAKDHGVHKTIAFVDNMDYTRISQSIGVDTLINVKLIAANNVFRFVRKGKIEAIASLDGVDAEIIEFVIQKDNRLTKTAIGELHLPEDAVIAGVIRGEQHFFPDADFIMQKDDKVIVFAQYSAISRVERIFR
jgi:trk system potassium uptake protein TrkA